METLSCQQNKINTRELFSSSTQTVESVCVWACGHILTYTYTHVHTYMHTPVHTCTHAHCTHNLEEICCIHPPSELQIDRRQAFLREMVENIFIKRIYKVMRLWSQGAACLTDETGKRKVSSSSFWSPPGFSIFTSPPQTPLLLKFLKSPFHFSSSQKVLKL